MLVYEKLCIADCSATTSPRKTYNHNGECVEECLNGFYGHLGKGQCLTECPDNYYAFAETNTCVTKVYCNQDDMYVYKQACIDDCTVTTNPAKTFYHDGTCLSQCSTNFYGLDSKGECFSECPDGVYGYDIDSSCINQETCNGKGRFIYDKLCIKDCTVPTLVLKPYYHNGVCVEKCPTGFFGHLG
jgi:hypothetical protein